MAALVALVSLVLVVGYNFSLASGEDASPTYQGHAGAVEASQLNQAKLTHKLASWVSEQCEQMAEEMDAIIRLEAAESEERFSLVNYLRYLSLFNQMSVVAMRDDVDQFRWVAKKVKAYRRAYDAATKLLQNYLRGLDSSLEQIEGAERKSKQEVVSQPWVQLYQTVNYIATHVSRTIQFGRIVTWSKNN